MYGNTVVTVFTLAIGQNGSKIAYFSHSAGTVHGAPPPKTTSALLARNDMQHLTSLLAPVALDCVEKVGLESWHVRHLKEFVWHVHCMQQIAQFHEQLQEQRDGPQKHSLIGSAAIFFPPGKPPFALAPHPLHYLR